MAWPGLAFLCWHQPALWALIPEKVAPIEEVHEWPQFMRGCVKYRQSLDEQLPDAPRTTEEFKGRSRRGKIACMYSREDLQIPPNKFGRDN